MRISVWSASVVLALTASIHNARAQEEEAQEVARAEQYAEAAYEAYSRGQFATAVALYGEALEAAPSPEILYNLARIYDTKLHDRAHAIEFYARYAQDPGADTERLQVATERLLTLRQQERLAARSAARGAARPAALSAALDHGDISVHPHATPKAYERGLTGYEVAGFVVGALGVASVATGIGFGFAAKSDADVVHSLCEGNTCTTQRGVDAAQRGKRMALLSTVGFAAGGGLLLVGAGLLLFGPRRVERDDTTHAQHTPRAELTPWAEPGGFGLQLASSF